jgi:hypothetical protein
MTDRSSKVTGPLFKWFGSKWLSSRLLPPPTHSLIVEPFAGGVGYSLRNAEKDVRIAEYDEHIRELWKWLINGATETLIRDIPIDSPEGMDIRALGLTRGQELLLKNWQRTNNVGHCWTTSPWGNKPGQWTANTRARVATEFGAVGHWMVCEGGFETALSRDEATWFIDPPYQFNYGYRSPPLDYKSLSEMVSALHGQIIVCEAVCQKTDRVPTWLPFTFFGSRITSRRKKENNHHSKELLWHRP